MCEWDHWNNIGANPAQFRDIKIAANLHYVCQGTNKTEPKLKMVTTYNIKHNPNAICAVHQSRNCGKVPIFTTGGDDSNEAVDCKTSEHCLLQFAFILESAELPVQWPHNFLLSWLSKWMSKWGFFANGVLPESSTGCLWTFNQMTDLALPQYIATQDHDKIDNACCCIWTKFQLPWP